MSVPGLHYYYDMSPSLECSASTILTWFPLYENDALVGMGFMLPGSLTLAKGDTDYFEHPKQSDVEVQYHKSYNYVHLYLIIVINSPVLWACSSKEWFAKVSSLGRWVGDHNLKGSRLSESAAASSLLTICGSSEDTRGQSMDSANCIPFYHRFRHY